MESHTFIIFTKIQFYATWNNFILRMSTYDNQFVFDIFGKLLLYLVTPF